MSKLTTTTRDLAYVLVSGSYANASLEMIVRDIIDRYLAPLGYSFGYAPNTAIGGTLMFYCRAALGCFDLLGRAWHVDWSVDDQRRISFGQPPQASVPSTPADATLDAMARELEAL